MMKPLIYVCEWCRNKETSWSGTDMAVRSRISRNFDVTDFDYGIRKPYAFVAKLIQKFFNKDIDVRPHFCKCFAKKFKGNNLILEMKNSEMPEAYDSSNKYFLYKDMVWGGVKRTWNEERDVLEVTGFANYNENEINECCDRENAFFANDNVFCLTMGHWLADFLVSGLHLPQERVCSVGGGY